MDKPIAEIKDRLQRAMSIRYITPKELSDATKIPKASISQYMSGYAKPKQDRIYILSKALNINPTWLLGYDVEMDLNVCSNEMPNSNEDALTLEEREYIKKYRFLDKYGIQVVKSILDIEYDRCIKEAEEIYEPTVMKPSFQSCLSAGTGQFVFDDIPSELIEVPAEYKDIDFVIGVSGDSMEPTYHDGDKVMIKKQEVRVGQIGAFMINGVALLKELGVDCLISHNKEYDDIQFEEGMRIDCVGKVVGKLN